MSLIIDNPDYTAVKEGFGDEEISFWDLPDQPSHFFPSDEKLANELNDLVDDQQKLWKQANEMIKLIPYMEHRFLMQYKSALNTVERQVVKICGNRVRFTPN